MKQPATIEFEGLDEFSFLSFNIRNLFDGKTEFLFFQINGLQRLTLFTQLNACEKNGMGMYRRLDGATQTVSINTAVKDIQERKVIKDLVFMLYAFGINA